MEEDKFLPDFSDICIVGRELTEFSVKKIGGGIRRLDLSFNSISKFKGLEICSNTLEELILDNNQLDFVEFLTPFPKLHTLSLNKNRIWNLRKLLSDLKWKAPELRYISLLGNPMCPDQLTDEQVDESDYQIYRYHVLYHLRNLKFLDHRQVTLKERLESHKELYGNLKLNSKVTPLPQSRKGPNTITSRQGRRRFKYLGKNSEGNRFIKDDDL